MKGAAVMTTPKTTRGGTREGAGRKPIAEGVESVVIQVRATPEQREKFHALGGADWFRAALKRAKLPTTLKD